MIKLLHETVKLSAEKHPDKAAFKCGDKAVTYAELFDFSSKVAYQLREHGLKKGDRVGILMSRNLETAIAIYGTLLSGGVYVPIDPTSPDSRIKFLINDCQIGHLVTIPRMKKKVLDLGDEINFNSVIGLDENGKDHWLSWDMVKKGERLKEQVTVSQDDLAYIMYTSGSTGIPKGLMHTHRSGLSYARLSANEFGLTSDDIIANHAPIHFDICTMGYFTAPYVSATTVLVTDAHTMMPASLSALVEDEKISVWYSVPLALTQMLQFGDLASKKLENLRWILFGGERFDMAQLRELIKTVPHATFSNVYGPAEVNQCTNYNFTSIVDQMEILPIGKTWQETEGLVVNDDDVEVNKNELGELLIHSTTMMRGYWNNPQLTEQSIYFQNNSGNEKRFYRTGDLVKKLDDGNLIFVERKDRQVKVRGYRVELDEVARAFQQMDSVAEAAVYLATLLDQTHQIEARLRLSNGYELNEGDLLKSIRDKVPAYAVPQKISIVSDFPRTSSGKIDYQKIRTEQTSK